MSASKKKQKSKSFWILPSWSLGDVSFPSWELPLWSGLEYEADSSSRPMFPDFGWEGWFEQQAKPGFVANAGTWPDWGIHDTDDVTE